MELHIKIHALTTLSVYKIGARTYLKGTKEGNFLPLVKIEQLLSYKKKRALLLMMYFGKPFIQKFFWTIVKMGFIFAKRFDV